MERQPGRRIERDGNRGRTDGDVRRRHANRVEQQRHRENGAAPADQPEHQADHELIRYVRVPDLDPTLVRDVDPTVSGADMASLLEFLARTMTVALGDEPLPTAFEAAPVTPARVVADGLA